MFWFEYLYLWFSYFVNRFLSISVAALGFHLGKGYNHNTIYFFYKSFVVYLYLDDLFFLFFNFLIGVNFQLDF